MAIIPRGIKGPVYRLLAPLLDALVRSRVHPNLLTTIGFLITVSAGVSYFYGHVRIGGFLVLLGGLFDILDGQVARQGGTASVFGSFYDSTLDRISEIVVFLGIFSLYSGDHPDFGHYYPLMVYVVALALAGSLMVSYTRARAEAMGLDCTVGMMQRPERVVLIGVASVVFGGSMGGLVLNWVLIIMAVLTNMTTFQRIVWVYRHTRDLPPPPAKPQERARSSVPVTRK